MKRERLSILVLVVEIAAVVYLHSVKTRQPISENKMAHGSRPGAATYQLKALPVAGIK